MHITATWFPLWHRLLSFVILVILVNLEIRDALSWSYFFLLHSATTSVSWVLVFQVWLVGGLVYDSCVVITYVLSQADDLLAKFSNTACPREIFPPWVDRVYKRKSVPVFFFVI